MRVANPVRRAARSLRRAAPWLFAAFMAPWTLLVVASAFVSVPEELRAPPPGLAEAPGPRRTSVRVTDRNGGVLADLRDESGEDARWVRLEDAKTVAAAMVAAEDRRFFWHRGIDPLRVTRATADSVLAGRVVSGASTISQQLARLSTGAPRSAAGKVRVMALAVRLELSLSKEVILEQYLNRAPFGARVRGVEAASRRFFDKPASELSLAEAATLAALPQSPARLDPRREAGRARLLKRRDEILGRMDGAEAEAIARARAEPLVLAPRFEGVSAPHFVRAAKEGRVNPCEREDDLRARDGVVAIETTLDPVLQEAAVEAARRVVSGIEDRHVTSAAAVVLDNATGDVLAWVGSPGQDDTPGGHNDGVLARRQPGSTLKPFVYGLAVERLGFSPATLLPDVELSFPARQGEYRPRNYDGTFHGPVLLREALGNSYNIPAVWTLQRLGAPALVRRLRELGFCSVERGAEHYGLALALGDAEVTLVELAAAYATLARGGERVRPRGVRRVLTWEGRAVEPPPVDARRVLRADAAYQVLDVLADAGARVDSFGERNVLDLPFPFAAKTGTSKGFRDNLAVGATPELTVAVWVGNMDGSPMRDVSGVTGAGPLLREIALAAVAARAPAGEPTTFAAPPGLVETAEVCAGSGRPAGPHCAHTRQELRTSSAPREGACDVHVEIAVDAAGALARRECPGVQLRVVERWPASFEAWASSAGRPVPPITFSSTCPPAEGSLERRLAEATSAPFVTFPSDGDRFHLDPGAAAPSAIEIVVRGRGAVATVDGEPLPTRGGRARWSLVRGRHLIGARDDRGHTSPPVAVDVE